MLTSRTRFAKAALPIVYGVNAYTTTAITIAVMVLAATHGRGGWTVTLALLSRAIPQIALAPLLAPLLDTISPRRIVRISLAVQATLACTCGLIDSTWAALTLLAAISLVGILDGPALLLLAESNQNPGDSENHRVRAFARMDTARLIGSLAGPVSGGALVAWVGPQSVFLGAAAALVLTATLLGLVGNTRSSSAKKPRSWWAQVKETPTALFSGQLQRYALIGLMASVVFTSIYSVAEVLYGLKTLDLSPFWYAILGQFFIFGRIVGSWIGGRITPNFAVRTLVLSTVLMGAGLTLPGLWVSSIAAGIGFGCAGIANAVQVIAIRLIVFKSVAESLRGRALSAIGSLNQAAGLIGMATAGAVVAVASPPGALLLAGGGTLAVALVVSLALRRAAVEVDMDAFVTDEHQERQPAD